MTQLDWTTTDAGTDREAYEAEGPNGERFILAFGDQGDSPGWYIETMIEDEDGDWVTSDSGILDTQDEDALEDAQVEAERYLGVGK